MATRYWVGGSGTWDASSTTHWSATSGGAAGASAPTSSDDVVFNSASAGASYIVTCSGTSSVCANMTTTAPAAGTLTFNTTTAVGSFFQISGLTVNIHAACLFTVNGATTASAYIFHYVNTVSSGAGTASVTFNSSGVNTQVIKWWGGNQNNAGYAGTYNFCLSGTQKFAQIYLYSSQYLATFNVVCTSATITVALPSGELNSSGDDSVEINGSSGYAYSPVTANLTSTTFNFGDATAWTNPTVYQNNAKLLLGNLTSLTTTGMVINCVRTYYACLFYYQNTSITGLSPTMGNLTVKAYEYAEVDGFNTFGAINSTVGWASQGGFSGLYIHAANSSGNFTFTCTTLTINANAASTLNNFFLGQFYNTYTPYGVSLTYYNKFTISGAVSIGAKCAVSLLEGSVSTLSSSIGGAITMGAGAYLNSYPNGAAVALSITSITSTGTLANPSYVNLSNTYANYYNVSASGNTSLTWTGLDYSASNQAYTAWEQLAATTFTATSPAPSTYGPALVMGSLKTNGGAISITNSSCSFNNSVLVGATYYSVYAGTGNLTLSNSASTTGGVFQAVNNIYFTSGATVTTWTDTYLSITANSGVLTVQGAGGLTITNTYTKFGGISVYGVSTVGPLTLTNSQNGVYCGGTFSIGGNFSHTYSAAIGFTGGYLFQVSGLATITGTCTLTAPASASFNVQFGNGLFINGAFATTFTNIGSCYIYGFVTGSKTISSTGAFTINNSTMGAIPSGGTVFDSQFDVYCTTFTSNNVSVYMGALVASTGTSYTAGTLGPTFQFGNSNTACTLGALSTNGGQFYSSGSGSGAACTATTVTTTNTSIDMQNVNLTASGAISITGDVAGTKYAYFNALIGASTVSFTNVYSTIIQGNPANSPTHTLKGTTLTINNSALTSPDTTGSTFRVGTITSAPQVVFTGLATINNAEFRSGAILNANPSVTFVGLTITKSTYTSTGLSFYLNYPTIASHSFGAITGSTGGYIGVDGGNSVSCSTITTTNVGFYCSDSGWTAAGAVAIAASPTSSSVDASFLYLINGAFATTFTSCNVSFYGCSSSGPSSGYSFYSTGNLVLDDSGKSSSGSIYAVYPIVFVTGAGVTTWTNKQGPINGITATGAGGLTLTATASTYLAGLSNATGAIAITGPLTLTNQKDSNGYALNTYTLTVGGNLVANNSASAGAASFVVVGSSAAITGTTTFTKVGLYAPSATFTSTGAASFTGEGSANSNFDNQFNSSSISTSGTSNLTIADYYSVTLGTVTAGGSLALTHASQVPLATSTGNITQSQVGGTTTITRVRLSGSNSNTFSSAGALTMSTSAAVYSFLSFSGAAVTSTAGSGNYSAITAGDITFTGAVALTNTHLWAIHGVGTGAITVSGGASKPFAWTIDANAIACDGANMNQTNSASYPGISFKTFTLSNSGSTFSVTSATVYKRPLVSFNQSTATSATMSIPSGVTPTFTNVDFWRIAPGGTSTKPWTGTSLGRVGGTIADLTTTTAKSVYYVGGSGSWEGAKWATSSGGTGATANYPLPQDTITFDSNSGGGTVTVPASIKIGTLFLASTPPGTMDISNSSSAVVIYETWITGGIVGPSTSGSFSLPSTAPVRTVFADGSSSDTITVTNAQNMVIGRNGDIQCGTAGTLSISEVYQSGTGALNFSPYGDGYSTVSPNIDYLTRVINFTSSTFTLSATNSSFYAASGTFNFGSCSISAYNIYIPAGYTTAIPSTPYTWKTTYGFNVATAVTESIGGSAVAHLGNLTYVPTGFTGTFESSVDNPKFLSIGITESSGFAYSFYILNLNAAKQLYTLSTFNVTNNGGGSFAFINSTGSNITLNGIAGARDQWTNITIGSATNGQRVNVLPASPATWYYSGGSLGAGQTGWNSGVAPKTTGFLFF